MGVPWLVAIIWLTAFTCLRIGLLITLDAGQVGIDLWPYVLTKGLLFDLATLAFLVAPVCLYEAVLPNRWRTSFLHKTLRLKWLWFSVFVMLFGIGNVPGVVVTVIFALPPMIRLTMLGIRQVPADLVEAAHSFGASPSQLLFKVQLPLAMPTIMAGVNQTLMLALSMVVIASMIAVGGLGQMVLRGIGRLDMGLASIGGLGIVLLAIVLDRLTQAMGQPDRTRTGRWYQHGPAALLLRLAGRDKKIDYKGVNA